MESYRFETLKGKHFACVYKLVFPNGKVYVGKSKDIGKRMALYERKLDGAWSGSTDTTPLYDALREYGLGSLEIEIVFRVNSASGSDWRKDLDYALGIVEIRWIKELGSNDAEVGYNSTDGGEMFGIRNLERVREVERERVVYKDVYVDRVHQTTGVPVVGYDINGNFIGVWESRIAFSREILNVNSTLGYGQWRKGYIMYEKKGDDYPMKVESYAEYLARVKAAEIKAKQVHDECVGNQTVLRDVKIERGVVFVSQDGQEEARYGNIRDAAIGSGFSYSNIYGALRSGSGMTRGHFVFWLEMWDGENEKCLDFIRQRTLTPMMRGKKGTHKKSKYGKIYQYDYKFNEIGVYDSIADAVEQVGLSQSNIYQSCKKGGESFAGEYHWRFEADRIIKEDKKVGDTIEESVAEKEDNQKDMQADASNGLLPFDW